MIVERTAGLPFEPRPWQLPLLRDKAARIVAVVHRRAGKSTALLWRGFETALRTKAPQPRVVHLLPYQVQWTRTGLWDQAKAAAHRIEATVNEIAGGRVESLRIMESERSIRFANGGTWQAGGADNPDSWRGGYADEVIADEFDDMPDMTLVIEPMLADRAGGLVRCGTPKGHGKLKAAYEKAGHAAEHSRYLLTWRDTGALSDSAIERLRAEMTPEEFAQELECSFEAPNSGSYYGKMLHAAETAGRITRVPYEPRLPVITAWDIGMADATAIWFAQITRAGEWRIIDYLEDAGVGFGHYVGELKARGYVYGEHLLPHDVEVREIGNDARSRRQTLHGLGVRPIRVIPASNPADRVNAARLILPKCYFDSERTAQGRKALASYRRAWDEAGQTWRSHPVHDWSSHAADAFGHLAQGAREPREEHDARRRLPPPQSWDPYTMELTR